MTELEFADLKPNHFLWSVENRIARVSLNRPELGHLSVGACADVAVFTVQSGRFGFIDCGRAKIIGDRRFECQLTIRAG